ncbi:MAG: phosphoribosylaminoimidazolesuccinocarboxamide synthase [Calditrichia bacterium]
MEIKDKIYEGSTKNLYATDNEEQLVLEFTDKFVSGKQKETISGKGAINKELCTRFFEYLQSYNVPTHFIKSVDETRILVKKLEMIPFTVQIWNIAGDSLAKRLGLKEGTVLETPVLELYLKNAKLKNPLINDYHAYSLKLCDRDEMNAIIRMTTKVNAVLKSYFMRKKMTLAHFTLEFGRSGSQILLGDELSLDNMFVIEGLNMEEADYNQFVMDSSNAKKLYSKLKEQI